MYAQPLIQTIQGSIGFYILHVLDYVELRVLPTQPMHTRINKVQRGSFFLFEHSFNLGQLRLKNFNLCFICICVFVCVYVYKNLLSLVVSLFFSFSCMYNDEKSIINKNTPVNNLLVKFIFTNLLQSYILFLIFVYNLT